CPVECGEWTAKRASRNLNINREEPMLVQPSRRSFMAGMAGTAAAGAFLPRIAIARDAAGSGEGLAYRTAGDLVKMLADRQGSSRELVDPAISRIEAPDSK